MLYSFAIIEGSFDVLNANFVGEFDSVPRYTVDVAPFPILMERANFESRKAIGASFSLSKRTL